MKKISENKNYQGRNRHGSFPTPKAQIQLHKCMKLLLRVRRAVAKRSLGYLQYFYCKQPANAGVLPVMWKETTTGKTSSPHSQPIMSTALNVPFGLTFWATVS